MLSNTSSGEKGDNESSKSSGVRKLVKRNNRQSEPQSQNPQQKPKVSRLGMKATSEKDSETGKKGIRRLGGDNKSSKTPESSNVSSVAGGSDNEYADNKFDINVADDWNRRAVSEKTDDSWDDCGDTWDDFHVEPICVKKKMYKCGPVSGEEEPQVFPRLQAPGTFKTPQENERRQFKNPEIKSFNDDEENEMPLSATKIQETTSKPSFLDNERHQNVMQQQQRPNAPTQTSWLRGSWLENVSKSVASLTAQVSQNISAALDTETAPQTDDLKQLVSERLKDHQESYKGDPTEESPRKGRKYLHKIGIEDDIQPVYAFKQKDRQTEVPSKVLKEPQTYDNKPQKKLSELNTATISKQVSNSKIPDTKKEMTNKPTGENEDKWDDNWDCSIEAVVPMVKKSQSQSGVKKGKTLDLKMATQGFLSEEVTKQERPVEQRIQKGTESVNIKGKQLDDKKSKSNKKESETPSEKKKDRDHFISSTDIKEETPNVQTYHDEAAKPLIKDATKKGLELQEAAGEIWDSWNTEEFETIIEEKTTLTTQEHQNVKQGANDKANDKLKVQNIEVEIDAWDNWDDNNQPEVDLYTENVVYQGQKDSSGEKQKNDLQNESKSDVENRENIIINEETQMHVIEAATKSILLADLTTSFGPENPKFDINNPNPNTDVQEMEIETLGNWIDNDQNSVLPSEKQDPTFEPVQIEPEVMKKDMYKCGHEQDEDEPSPKQSFDQPLKIAVNEEQEWNDWDQEMIVDVTTAEEPILTLQTPLTEMHISSSVKSSTLHSPPYTIDNERVRGARGSICEFVEYVPPLGDLTKQEMEERIKASLSVEMNKFYEQSSDNEWNESESEMVFEDELSDSCKEVVQKLEEITMEVVTNDWPSQEKSEGRNELKNESTNVGQDSSNVDENIQKEESDLLYPDIISNNEPSVEPEVIKKDMYKCGSEDESEPDEPVFLSSATTHVEIPPIQEIVEETVEYTTVKSQCFSVPVPAVIPSIAESLGNASKEPEIPELEVYSTENNSNPEQYTVPNDSNALRSPLSATNLTINDSNWAEDDWGSNVSDPGNSQQDTSESDSDEEPDVGILDDSHPDVRLPTKQKTVEECINLLKQNREELKIKLENQKQESERESLEDTQIIEEKITLIEVQSSNEEKLCSDLDSQIVPHPSQFSPEPTKQASWEDDEDELSFVVSNKKSHSEDSLSDSNHQKPSENPQKGSEKNIPDALESNDVEPVVVSRSMYKCGTPDEDDKQDVNPLDTFESRKVEGSENKRPDPIGASFEQDIVTSSPEMEIEPEIQPEMTRNANTAWDDWNDEESENNVLPNKTSKNEIPEPDDNDWNDNWGDEDEEQGEDVKVESIGVKPESVDPIELSVTEAETSNDNDWDDFDAWGEENVADEMEIQVQNQNVVQETPVFKVPEPPTHPSEHHEPIENVFSKLENKNQWNWKSNWGVSLIANASKNVASITAQVSQNLSSALDTGLIPQPEEMAKIVRKDQELTRQRTSSESSHKSRQSKESSVEPPNVSQAQESDDNRSRKSSVESMPDSEKEKRRPFIPLTNLVTGVTQISSKVITGGLDTLEGIGKKTFTMIQENVKDADRKGLSDILHEAKIENSPVETKPKEKLPQFDIMFDDYGGLVHLEALEILSKQATIKIEMILAKLSGDELTKMQETLQEVEELYVVPNVSEIEQKDGSVEQLEDRLLFAVRDLDVELTFVDVQAASKRINKYLLRNAPIADAKELYNKALDTLAEFTSLAVARFHKLAELLSVAEYHSTANEVDALVSLTTIFYWQINNIATRFNKLLNAMDKSNDTSLFITNIFLEASHANSYIEQAFIQFTPILKMGATF